MKIYDSEPTRPKFQPISGSWKFSDTTCYMTPELNVENFMIIKLVFLLWYNHLE